MTHTKFEDEAIQRRRYEKETPQARNRIYDKAMLRIAEERVSGIGLNDIKKRRCVEPYDFEPVDTWSMEVIIQGLLGSICMQCTQRPPDKLMCHQRFCYRRECVENSLREVEQI